MARRAGRPGHDRRRVDRAAAPRRQPRAVPRAASPRSGSRAVCSRASRATSATGMAARAGLIGDVGGDAPEHWEPGLRAGRGARPRHAVGRRPGGARGRGRPLASRRDMAAHGLEPGFEQEAAQARRRPRALRLHRRLRPAVDRRGRARRRRRAGRRRAPPAVAPPAPRPRPVRDRSPRGLAAAAAGRVRARLRRRGRRPAARAGPAASIATATFMVWRKLRQDVAGVPRVARRARPAAPASSAGLVAAKVIGRWPRRQPARAAAPTAATRRSGNDRERVNDFALRRRPGGPRAARAAPTSAARTRATRLGRRGYGSPPAIASCAAACPTAPRLRRGRRGRRAADRGLVFVALQASIERQFEIVQARWLQRRRRVRPRPDAGPGRGARSARRPARPSADARRATPRRCAATSATAAASTSWCRRSGRCAPCRAVAPPLSAPPRPPARVAMRGAQQHHRGEGVRAVRALAAVLVNCRRFRSVSEQKLRRFGHRSSGGAAHAATTATSLPSLGALSHQPRVSHEQKRSYATATAWNTVPREVTPSGQTHPWSQMP